MTMDPIDVELTYLDGEEERLNRAINSDLQILNSTPMINAPGVRVRRRRRPSVDTASIASDVYPAPRTSHRPRRISSIGGTDRSPSPRRDRGPSTQTTHAPQSSFSKPKNYMKPATYDGTGLWNDYLSHFESVSQINHSTEIEMGLYLAASLRGQA